MRSERTSLSNCANDASDYHCQRQCRAVNISKGTLEGAFVDELALLQPTPGYMRLVKDRILCVGSSVELMRTTGQRNSNGG